MIKRHPRKKIRCQKYNEKNITIYQDLSKAAKNVSLIFTGTTRLETLLLGKGNSIREAFKHQLNQKDLPLNIVEN